MSDYLLRDDAPLSAEVWKQIDVMVANVVTRNLVGRRVVPLVGPLGWGVEVAPVTAFGGEDEGFVASTAKYVTLETLEAGFRLRLKQLAMADQTPFGLDLGAVATAASKLAKKEDKFVLGGLMANASKGALGDWSVPNGPFSAIAAATAAMRGKGIDGPVSLVLGLEMHAKLASLVDHGQREIKAVQKLVQAGIYASPVMPEGQALLVSSRAWDVDMVVGQDIATAFVGNEGLDLMFCILETLALRFKRQGAALLLS